MSTSTLRANAALLQWDVIVIGAGVAGGAAALGIARRLGSGARVLLVERSAWPRAKVCGCCLNHAAVETLARLGLVDRFRAVGAARLDSVELRCARGSQRLVQPEGFAIDRAALDALMVAAAVDAGVEFRPESSAVIQPTSEGREREVEVCTRQRREVHRARLVVAADGLGGGALRELQEFRVEVRPGSWMGASAIVDGEPLAPAGVVQMNVGRRGYVGVVRLGERTTNVGAALDPRWVKEVGGPGPAVNAILEECGGSGVSDIGRHVAWTGTPLLTRRRRRVAAPGVMVVGDAAGYVEPFTGEGMMWALASAEAGSELVEEFLKRGDQDALADLEHQWERWHAESIRPRQRVCGLLRLGVHRPWVFGAAIRLMNVFPRVQRVGGGVCGRLSAPIVGPQVAGVPA